MQSKASTIPEYLAGLTQDARGVIEAIDAAVRAAHPAVRGDMKYGMPTYALGDRMFAFNAQKHYFAVYADPELVQKYQADLKGLDVGKSCIRFRRGEQLPVEAIRKILHDYPATAERPEKTKT